MNWTRANAVAWLALIAVAWLALALIRALVISARNRHSMTPTEQFSRTEKVRAEIRRKIAQRRVESSDATTGTVTERPVKRGAPIPPIDPFGGPGRRWWDWIRERLRRGRR